MAALAHPPEDYGALRALLEGDVVDAARGLIGCRIAHGDLAIVIVETEAYHEREPACHGYGGHTPRAQMLRRPPGFSYVYLSYGIHRLVNVVTGSQETASAVLLRGGVVLAPPAGARGAARPTGAAGVGPAGAGVPGPGARGAETSVAGSAVPGPGRLGKVLGMGAAHDGVDLLAGGPFRLEPADPRDGIAGRPLGVGPRVGITKAVELPWRFALADSPGVSRPRL